MSSVLAVLPCSAGKYPVENMNGSVIYLESEKNRGKLKNKKKTSSAAKELLKNGILVETNKG